MKNKRLIKKYFLLGEQYGEVAIFLLETLIENGNSNSGVSNTIEEATRIMEEKSVKSDLYLFVPAIFNCLQCTELYVKGLILLSNKNFSRGHNAEDLLKILKEGYGENSEVFTSYNAFYKNQIKIISDYKAENSIVVTEDLYMSLRYPEITLHLDNNAKVTREIEYEKMMYNGKKGIIQFKKLLKALKSVKKITLKEYDQKYPLL